MIIVTDFVMIIVTDFVMIIVTDCGGCDNSDRNAPIKKTLLARNWMSS